MSAVLAALFAGENRDYVADKMLLRRSYQNWLPIRGPDLNFSYYTDSHQQSVVDSYGYTFHYFSHLVSRVAAFLLGEEFRALDSTSVNSQNALIAVVGVVGCWAVGVVCRETFGSKRAELVGIAGSFALPMWLGHSWMNQKDVPFAVGFTCATAAAVITANLLHGESAPRPIVRDLSIATFLAVSLTFGTRPGLAILVLPLFAYGWWQVRRRVPVVQMSLATAVFGATVLVLFTNPASIPNPIGWAWNGVSVGRSFIGYAGDVLFDGALVKSKDLGWWYLVKSFVSSLPLVSLLGLVSGAVFLLLQIRRGAAGMALPVVYQAAIVAVVVLGLSGNNYNAGRQYLFVILGWQMVAVLGLWSLAMVTNQRWRQTARATIVVLVGLLIIDHVSIFPYQYVYRNEVARQADDFVNRGEFDYWAMAGRELVAAVPNEPGVRVYFGSGDRPARGKYIPQSGWQYLPDGATAVDDATPDPWKSDTGIVQVDYVPWLHYWPPRLDEPFRVSLSTCDVVHSAYAVMAPQRVLLGRLYKCR